MTDDQVVTKKYLDETLDKRFSEFEERFEKKIDKKLDQKFGIFMEQVDDKFAQIVEVLVPMKEMVDRIPKIEADIEDIKAELANDRLAIKATNRQVANHEARITKLEARPV